MKNLVVLVLLGAALNAHAQGVSRYVNPFIGTDAHGHTFPGATVPFGMVQLSPDTRVEGWDACSGYHYSDSTILGFSHTHLSGTGCADYGDILVSPTTGTPDVSHAAAHFSHAHESAAPGYYSVLLTDSRINVELTATRRTGVHRYTFPKTGQANLIVNLQHGIGPDRVIASSLQIMSQNEIAGFRRSAGWAKDQVLYFAAQFSRPVASFGLAVNDTVRQGSRQVEGNNVKAFVQFSMLDGAPLVVKIGLSSVSVEGARKNVQEEAAGKTFAELKKEAAEMWETELGRIEVEGGTPEQASTFYTALYHAFLAPNLYSDADGAYRGMDGTIHHAEGFDMYTVFSLWDTFRAEHPLFTIVDPKRALDLVKSLLAKYEEAKVLPVWELSSNETWCMIGYHAVPVIVDAYVKGIDRFDAEKALAAMKHSSMLDHFGLKDYRAHGYIPAEMESESVSKTLEYAYDDWCIAVMAKALKRPEDAAAYERRAGFYRNVLDASTGFMRAKDNGSWVAPFDPTAVTNFYTEANSWQYSFFVPHDIDGLIGLLGGRQAFIARLDSLFYMSSNLSGREQADITGLIGQYAQGNEPSHHVAYLYNYAGAPWKTQKVIRLIMDSLYTSKPGGLCGNDDCGQMSAWYVMSAMGFYQVCPGQPVYEIGSPLFSKVAVHLDNGKSFVIQADGNSASRKFVQSAALNGSPYTRSWISHNDIMGGSVLKLQMGEQPSLTWGSLDADCPHSPPAQASVAVPFIPAAAKTFSDSMTIILACNTPGADIFYTTDGSQPGSASQRYTSPVTIRNSVHLKAVACKDGVGRSETVTAEFTKRNRIGTIVLHTKYSPQYAAGGPDALIDGVHGATDFRVGGWQGYEGEDLDATVDLGSVQEIASVGLGCLQDINSWIFFPTSVDFSFSEDGKAFSSALIMQSNISPRNENVQVKEFGKKLDHLKTRYIRVHAVNLGVCPSWHKGAGSKAWLFADELSVGFGSEEK